MSEVSCCLLFVLWWWCWAGGFNGVIFVGRSIIVKKGDGSQVKESTDSSTTLEDDDIKGKGGCKRRAPLAFRERFSCTGCFFIFFCCESHVYSYHSSPYTTGLFKKENNKNEK